VTFFIFFSQKLSTIIQKLFLGVNNYQQLKTIYFFSQKLSKIIQKLFFFSVNNCQQLKTIYFIRG